MLRSNKSNPKPAANATLSLAAPAHRYTFEAIGTRWVIEFYQVVDEAEFARVCRLIDQRIEDFDQAYSRFRPDSLVTQMSRQAGRYQLPADAAPLLALYRQLYELTDGRVTPLIGQQLVDAGYDTMYSLHPGHLSDAPSWERVINYQDPWIDLVQPAVLDFGGLGKGYLVDLIAELLEQQGITTFCVDAGGDMTYRGAGDRVLPVGLEHPDQLGQAIGIVNLRTGSLCGSAGNRRVWGGFHHIIDPQLKASPRHLKAIWVVADTTMLADGLTTALYFVSPAVLVKRYNFEYAIMSADNSLQYSPGFPAEFF